MHNSYHTVLKSQPIPSGNRIQEVSMSRKENVDNRANQMNPNNDAYWRTRGYDERPHDWEGRSTGEDERKDQRRGSPASKK